MDRQKFDAMCKKAFELNSLPLTDEQADKMYVLSELLLRENEKYNLTAVKSMAGVVSLHLADSALVSEHIPCGARVIDVGAGAGFPSLPLAILREDISVVSLDSTAKRVNFIKLAADELGLKNIDTVCGRAEELSQLGEASGLRESFDVAVARAVAGYRILSELCLPYVKCGGLFVAMKSRAAEAELEEARSTVKILGGASPLLLKKTLECLADDFLSGQAAESDRFTEERSFIISEKIAHTQKNHPRKYAQIMKKTL